MLVTGTTAPDFALPNQHGDPVSLSDYRGRRVVLYFYPRADTPGCTTEACGFRDAWDEFAAADVAVLGVSDDPVADLEPFAEEYDLPFELLSDEEKPISEIVSDMLDVPLFRLIMVVAMTNIGSIIASVLFVAYVLPLFAADLGGVDAVTRLMLDGAANSADLIWRTIT